jgi:hypothetical protein
LIQPALYAVASIAAALSSSAILLSSRWRHQVPLWARFACMLALLCSPQVDDAFAILSNSHWWLAIGLMSLGMLMDPPGRLWRMGELVFTAVAGLSGFAAVFGLPILGVRAIRNRSRHSVAILAIAAGGALVQISYLVASGRHGALASIASDPGAALLVLVKRILATDALGPANLTALTPLKTIDWLVIVVAIALGSALGLVWIRALRHQATRLEAAAFGLTFVGGWFLSMWALTMPGLSLDMLFWPAAAARYFVVPTAALYLSMLLWRPGGRAALTALSVACVLLAAGILSGYRLLPMPSVDWAPFAECVDRGSPDCSVEIPPAWQLEVDARTR